VGFQSPADGTIVGLEGRRSVKRDGESDRVGVGS